MELVFVTFIMNLFIVFTVYLTSIISILRQGILILDAAEWLLEHDLFLGGFSLLLVVALYWHFYHRVRKTQNEVIASEI
jgi:hypothetical protein